MLKGCEELRSVLGLHKGRGKGSEGLFFIFRLEEPSSKKRGAPSLGEILFSCIFFHIFLSSHHSGVLFIDFIAKSRLRVDLVVGRFSKITRLVINSNDLTYHCIHHIHHEF